MTANNQYKKPFVKRVMKFLEKLYDFRFNEVTGYVEFKKKKVVEKRILNDYELNSMQNLLDENELKISGERLYKLLKSSYIEFFNPFTSYFKKIKPWDETTDYISQLADTVKTTNDELWKLYFPKWLVAMVASLLDEKSINHEMLVFSGKQGIGKTTWILKLAPLVLNNYTYSGIINLNNKDTLAYLVDRMIINLDELEAFNGKQIAYLKQLITKNSLNYRPPYGKLSESFPRRASFAASVNDNEFLHDLSGSRRFLSFEALEIDYLHKVDMDGVYAQAYHLWKSGFKFWFSDEEIDEINSNNENYRIKSLEEVLLFEKFEVCNENESTNKFTATELLQELHYGNRNNINNASLQQLGKVLSHHKFNHAKRRKGKVYFLKAKDPSLLGYQP